MKRHPIVEMHYPTWDDTGDTCTRVQIPLSNIDYIRVQECEEDE